MLAVPAQCPVVIGDRVMSTVGRERKLTVDMFYFRLVGMSAFYYSTMLMVNAQ